MKKFVISKEVCTLIFTMALILLLSYVNVLLMIHLKNFITLPENFILPISKIPLMGSITFVFIFIEFFVILLFYSGLKKI